MNAKLPACCLGLALAAAAPVAHAQAPDIDFSPLDPVAVAALGSDVLRRAPDAAIDDLFQAVHAASRSREEAAVLCALFEPGADRSLPGLQRAADRLGADSRERFAGAFVGIAIAGLQGQPQPYDPAAAQQALKAAAVKAGFLHEGFGAALNADGDDAVSRDARCRAFRQLVGVLGDEPLPARAAATRWLLDQGLNLALAAR